MTSTQNCVNTNKDITFMCHNSFYTIASNEKCYPEVMTLLKGNASEDKMLSLLNRAEVEPLTGRNKLVALVEKIVQESGNPEGFDAAQWFDNWANKPSASFEGKKPNTLMETPEGQEAISTLLLQSQHGVYI